MKATKFQTFIEKRVVEASRLIWVNFWRWVRLACHDTHTCPPNCGFLQMLHPSCHPRTAWFLVSTNERLAPCVLAERSNHASQSHQSPAVGRPSKDQLQSWESIPVSGLASPTLATSHLAWGPWAPKAPVIVFGGLHTATGRNCQTGLHGLPWPRLIVICFRLHLGLPTKAGQFILPLPRTPTPSFQIPFKEPF
jgi:hypothetical protein